MPTGGWPISVRTEGDRTFIGIPERTGDGGPLRVDAGFPTLEEIGGDDWSDAFEQVYPEPYWRDYAEPGWLANRPARIRRVALSHGGHDRRTIELADKGKS